MRIENDYVELADGVEPLLRQLFTVPRAIARAEGAS